MEKFAQGTSLEQRIAAIQALDLDPIKLKLMDREEGQGWSRPYVDRMELAYRRYLTLLVKYPDENVAPTKDIDKFWHGHILDTLKYAEDCQNIFGRFLHHFPYFGMRGTQDRNDLTQASNAMARLYAQEFGEALPRSAAWCIKANTAPADAAWCIKADAQSADAAWCIKANATQTDAAWCIKADAPNAAWCIKAAVQQDAAWCIKAEAQPVDAAWCIKAEAIHVDAAWCIKAEAQYVDAAWCIKANLPGHDAAWCIKADMAPTTAWCIKAGKPTADAAWCIKSGDKSAGPNTWERPTLPVAA